MARQGTWYCPDLFRRITELGSPANTPGGKRDRASAAVCTNQVLRSAECALKIVFGTDIVGISWTEPIALNSARSVRHGPVDANFRPHFAGRRDAGHEGRDWRGGAGAFADIVAVRGDPLKGCRDPETRRFVMPMRRCSRTNHEIEPPLQKERVRVYVPSLLQPRTIGAIAASTFLRLG